MNWIQKAAAYVFNLESYGNDDCYDDRRNIFGVDYNLFDIQPEFMDCSSDIKKLAVIFSNPAVLRVFRLQCDLFSLGKFYVYKDGKAVDKDPFLDFIKNPNPFQTRQKILWTYMFYKMLGNAYMYTNSKIIGDTTKMYFLDSSKLTMPIEFEKYKDRIVLSKEMENSINRMDLKYSYSNGDTWSVKWGDISLISDLSNGTGNWFRGPSMIDSLYEIISNSKASIRSKNINVRYAGKYMIAGKADPTNVTQMPMGAPEQQDIETKMNGPKSVHAVKSMIDIQRFVEQATILEQLDKSFHDDFYKVGASYGIPKDVLEASLSGATYENQAESRAGHVTYTLSPAGESFCDAINRRFSYSDGREVVLSWDHLPFMQAQEKRRAELQKTKADTLLLLMKVGVPLEEINKMLDLELTTVDYEAAQRQTTNSGQAGSSENQNQQ